MPIACPVAISVSDHSPEGDKVKLPVGASDADSSSKELDIGANAARQALFSRFRLPILQDDGSLTALSCANKARWCDPDGDNSANQAFLTNHSTNFLGGVLAPFGRLTSGFGLISHGKCLSQTCALMGELAAKCDRLLTCLAHK